MWGRQEKRGADRRTWWGAVATAVMLVWALCGCVQAKDLKASQKDSLILDSLAVSPDGGTVAFQFRGLDKRITGVGLYEWRTGRLTRVPNPPGVMLRNPSFSHDGKRLAAITRNLAQHTYDVAVIDLNTMTIKQITHDDPQRTREKHHPVFQPETGNILYIENGFGVFSHFKMVNTNDGSEKNLTDENNGFYIIYPPYFVKKDEIYFQAAGPREINDYPAIKELGLSVGSTLSYRLIFGNHPQILSYELESERRQSSDIAVIGLSASRDGATMIGIGRNRAEPENSRGKFNSEIFEISKDFTLKQLTDRKSRLGYACIAYDGSVVAFQSDPTRQNRFELLILDLQSNTITETGLPGRLEGNPSFTLP